MMCVYVFVYISGCQSKSCLSILFHFSINQTSNTAVLLQGENVSKQLLQQLTERQLSKRRNEITTHSCAGPFRCFSNGGWGLSWRNQYLPSPVLVWLFVIQWGSTEVNGTKQVSACLACLCSAESLIHHSGDVYRLEFQCYKHFPVAGTISVAGLNRAILAFMFLWGP